MRGGGMMEDLIAEMQQNCLRMLELLTELALQTAEGKNINIGAGQTDPGQPSDMQEATTRPLRTCVECIHFHGSGCDLCYHQVVGKSWPVDASDPECKRFQPRKADKPRTCGECRWFGAARIDSKPQDWGECGISGNTVAIQTEACPGFDPREAD